VEAVVLFEGVGVFVMGEHSGEIASEYFVTSADMVSILLLLSQGVLRHFTY
jgi:hypothetical protein